MDEIKLSIEQCDVDMLRSLRLFLLGLYGPLDRDSCEAYAAQIEHTLQFAEPVL